MRWGPEGSSLWRVLGLLAGGCGAVLLLAARLAGPTVEHLAHCPLRDATGVPCPTCGGTHAVLALARGHPGAALAENPLVALGTVVVLLWCGWSLLATAWPPARRTPRLSSREQRLLAVAVAAAWILNWVYELATKLG